MDSWYRISLRIETFSIKDMHQFYLSKKDAKKIEEEIKNIFGIKIEEMEYVGNRAIELDKNNKIFILGKVILVKEGNIIFPSLAADKNFLEKFPSLKVDSGAIPYICRGAKIMRPGIVSFESDFNLDNIVCVKDAAHNKFVAIGKALVNKSEAEKMNKGPILDNLHYIGDKYWILLKNIKL